MIKDKYKAVENLLVGSHIFLHCAFGPTRKPVPTKLIIFPTAYKIAKVSIFVCENPATKVHVPIVEIIYPKAKHEIYPIILCL